MRLVKAWLTGFLGQRKCFPRNASNYTIRENCVPRKFGAIQYIGARSKILQGAMHNTLTHDSPGAKITFSFDTGFKGGAKQQNSIISCLRGCGLIDRSHQAQLRSVAVAVQLRGHSWGERNGEGEIGVGEGERQKGRRERAPRFGVHQSCV